MIMTASQVFGQRARPQILSSLQSLREILHGLWAPARRASITDLRRLDAHLLRDIGLTQADVTRLAGAPPAQDSLEIERLRR